MTDPIEWMKECSNFWNRYTYLNEAAQEKCEEQAKMWIDKLRTELPREWVGLTDEEIKDILDCGRGGLIDIKKTEQKLKEKNAC